MSIKHIITGLVLKSVRCGEDLWQVGAGQQRHKHHLNAFLGH